MYALIHIEFIETKATENCITAEVISIHMGSTLSFFANWNLTSRLVLKMDDAVSIAQVFSLTTSRQNELALALTAEPIV